ALANEVGVKGTSGMRKNELIAAIRERRGEPIGNARNGGSNETATTDTPAEARAPAAPGDAPVDSEASAPPKTDSGKPESSDDTADKSTDEAKPDGRQAGDRGQAGDQPGGQYRDDEGDGRQGRRGRRFRDRRRRERGGEGNADAELRDDDVVQPVAGILD